MAREPVQPIEVKIARRNPNNVPPIYTNDMSVSCTDKEMIVTFSFIDPPQGSEEEIRNLKEIQATAVAKLAMTPEFAENIIKVLTEVVEGHEKRGKK